MVLSQRSGRSEKSAEGVFVSFADLFMCLLVVMLFQMNPPAPVTEVLSDTGQEASAEDAPLYLRLHDQQRLTFWDTPGVELEVSQIAQEIEKKNANALVLIGDTGTTIDTYFDVVNRLAELQVPISYGREKHEHR